MKETVDCIYKKVLDSLNSAFDPLKKKTKVLLAVSGGIDSMVMLAILHRYMCETDKISFSVVTVNHNIRDKVVSEGDCLVVSDFCNERNILCEIVEIPQGKIAKLAEKRNKGIEETARFLRYEILKDRLVSQNADFILTAHNKNDNLETIIQRFFQGSLVNGGIEVCYNAIFRPLLVLSRKEIEEYAQYFQIPYVIDETNLQNDYYRNKIRNILIPLLNEEFVGWNSGVEKGALKKRIDEDFFAKELNNFRFEKNDDTTYSFSLKVFETLHEALKIRLMYKTLTEMGVEERIPFSVVYAFLSEHKQIVCKNISFFVEDNKVWIKRLVASSINREFFAIIDKIGSYEMPFGGLEITTDSQMEKECLYLKGITLPFSLYENEKRISLVFSDGEEVIVDKKDRLASSKKILLNSESELCCFFNSFK